MAHGADHTDKCWSEKKKFFFKSLSLGEMEQGKGGRERRRREGKYQSTRKKRAARVVTADDDTAPGVTHKTQEH